MFFAQPLHGSTAYHRDTSRRIALNNPTISEELITGLRTFAVPLAATEHTPARQTVRSLVVRGWSEAPFYRASSTTSPCGMADRNTRSSQVGG